MCRVPLESLVLQIKAMLTGSIGEASTNVSAGIGNSVEPTLPASFMLTSAFISPCEGDDRGGTLAQPAVNSTSADAQRISNELNCTFVLSLCPDPPHPEAVSVAEKVLVGIRAIDADTGALTPLGRQLSLLPCSPTVGRLLVYGVLLGVTKHITAVAACLSCKSPFLTAMDSSRREEMDAIKQK